MFAVELFTSGNSRFKLFEELNFLLKLNNHILVLQFA